MLALAVTPTPVSANGDAKLNFFRGQYRLARTKARRKLNNARRKSLASFASTLNVQTPMLQVFKRVRKIVGKFSPGPSPVLNVNRNKVSDGQAVANTLAETFSFVSTWASRTVDRQCETYEARQLDFSFGRDESYNVPYSLPELRTSLSLCKDSSPGSNNITYCMIRHLDSGPLSFLLGLFNKIWSEGYVPPSWKSAMVIPIPKPGKDAFIPLNYRPIALTICMMKVFEKMVNTRLIWFLENVDHLSSVQCGFRRCRSTLDALLRLEATICQAFACRQRVVSVFFDLEKAYDTTWRYVILRATVGLRGHLPLFLRSFLRDRTFRVRVGIALSSSFEQEEGIPQVSVLILTLFSVAINSITKCVHRDLRCTLYADDFSLFCASSRLDVAERHIQLAFGWVTHWADSHGLKFFHTNTVAMLFSRSRGEFRDPDLYLYDRRLPVVETTLVLGLMLDGRLTWLPIMRDLKTICQRRMSLLRFLSHVSWGADRTILLRLYHSFILSKLDYGSQVYCLPHPTQRPVSHNSSCYSCSLAREMKCQ